MNITSQPQSGIIPMTQWEILQVSGPDAASFLQGQLSCDVNTATDQQTLLGCYCNLQGRMQAAFRLWRYQESFLLMLPIGMATALQTALQPYARFSKVTLTPTPDDLMLLATVGLSGIPLLEQANVQIISLPDDAARLLYVGPATCLSQLQTQWHHQYSQLPPTTWQLRDIIHGIANVFVTTQAQWLPHRVNYHLIGGINFTKGCFLGQEIIARLHYKSQLKHHSYRVRLHSAQSLPAGTPITQPKSGSPLGYVIDSVSEANQSTQQALVLLPVTHEKSATLSMLQQAISVDWLSLPYTLDTHAN
ncbi:MAG: hypothetical protein GKR77_03575 [Legionellales bacterium]|nr:hypothetical protein [Legionellales bacterium]